MVLTLKTPLREIKGVGQMLEKKLERLGIKTVKDLLWHLPSRHEDFSHLTPISKLKAGDSVTVSGKITAIQARRTWRRKMMIVEAIVSDGTGSVRAIWFHQLYLMRTLKPGTAVNLAGKVSWEKNGLVFAHPSFEIREQRAEIRDQTGTHTGGLIPVYPETEGLTSRWLRTIVARLLKDKTLSIPEFLPQELLQIEKFPLRKQALIQVHFPKTSQNIEPAQKRLAFEELLVIQLAFLQAKARIKRVHAPAFELDEEVLNKFLKNLPYKLTAAQTKAVKEILDDLAQEHPMNRLLEGDVGSGKTVVAAVAALSALESGYQAAFLAPTEILARQHFQNLIKLLSHTPYSLALLTAAEQRLFWHGSSELTSKASLAKGISAGLLPFVVGTHALLGEKIEFSKLGLIIVDEQHRFGVEQRAALIKKQEVRSKNYESEKETVTHNSKFLIPHLLSMTATPIPRTLALTIYGDLDLSVLDELPPGRQKIITKAVARAERTRAYQFIAHEIRSGRQTFVICPRIEPAEEHTETYETIIQEEVRAVKKEYEKLSKEVFRDFRVGMLHGKMPSKDKEEVMRKFTTGELDILVSTSVVEVGIDIPNATVMMIEGSERFGLAQLHQFRGRVGRGEHQSYCFLFTDSPSKSTAQRLKAIVEAKSSFELAEKDLQIRGPGDFVGTRQSGFPDLAMRSLQDIALVKKSRDWAEKILSQNPQLKNYPLLQEEVNVFRKESHLE